LSSRSYSQPCCAGADNARNSFGIFYELDSTSNRTYTDLIQWTTEFYDITVYWFDNTLERLKLGCSFPEGYIDGSYILVGLSDEENQTLNLWGWLEPFHTYVWVMITVTIFLSGLIYQLLETIGNPNRYKGWRTQDTLGNNVFLSLLLFTQHFQFQPRTPASRLFAGSLALWALLISSAYTANLASFFVVKNTAKSTIQSVEDAISEDLPLCLWHGTASDSFMRSNYPKANFIMKEDELDIFYGIAAGDCAFGVLPKKSLEEYARDQTLNVGCNLDWYVSYLEELLTLASGERQCTLPPC
jgi:Ligand-gated ion channel